MLGNSTGFRKVFSLKDSFEISGCDEALVAFHLILFLFYENETVPSFCFRARHE